MIILTEKTTQTKSTSVFDVFSEELKSELCAFLAVYLSKGLTDRIFYAAMEKDSEQFYAYEKIRGLADSESRLPNGANDLFLSVDDVPNGIVAEFRPKLLKLAALAAGNAKAPNFRETTEEIFDTAKIKEGKEKELTGLSQLIFENLYNEGDSIEFVICRKRGGDRVSWIRTDNAGKRFSMNYPAYRLTPTDIQAFIPTLESELNNPLTLTIAGFIPQNKGVLVRVTFGKPQTESEGL
ncbi:hypothetical protein AGMMS49975_10470 [Clostridia bacterium]|nr:hypothetical protein AGMMS49975_10470 [Clostridia bacterium]